MKHRLLMPLPVLLAVAALGVAGCGGDDDNDSGTAAGGTDTQKQPAGGTGAPKVSMKDIQFVPESITAKVGEKITWTNDDSVAHTVTKEKGFKGKGPESDTVDPGQTYTFTPTKAGTIPYFCQIHPNQKGTIIVTR